MSWNYRVLRSFHTSGDYSEYAFTIHEVYYDKEGNPKSWSKNSIDPHGTSMDELKSDMKMMSSALEKPVLEVYAEKGIDKLREV